jgi:hypothetical protein
MHSAELASSVHTLLQELSISVMSRRADAAGNIRLGARKAIAGAGCRGGAAAGCIFVASGCNRLHPAATDIRSFREGATLRLIWRSAVLLDHDPTAVVGCRRRNMQPSVGMGRPAHAPARETR